MKIREKIIPSLKMLSKVTLGILKKEIDRSGGVKKTHAKWKKEWEKLS